MEEEVAAHDGRVAASLDDWWTLGDQETRVFAVAAQRGQSSCIARGRTEDLTIKW